MEYARVLKSYKVYLICLIMIIITALGTYYEIDGNQLVKDYSSVVDTDYDLDQLDVQLEEMYLTNPMEAQRLSDVITVIKGEEEFLQDYHDSNKGVIDKAKELKTRVGKGDYDKVIADFTKLDNVAVTKGNNYAVTQITDNRIVNIMLVGLAFVLAFLFLDERKRGMWEFVYSTRYGRGRLALQRCFIGMLLSAVVAGLVYIASIVVCFRFTGVPDFNRSIQSIECFSQFPFELNISEFLILFGVMKMLGSMLMFLIVFLLMSATNNRSVATVAGVVVITLEAILYYSIPMLSNLEFLKFWNVFYLGFGIEDYTLYKNYVIFDNIVIYRLYARLILLLVIMGISIAAIVIIANKQKPKKSTSIIQYIMSARLVGAVIEKLPNCLVEYRKMLLWSRGIIILIIAVIMGMIINPTHDVSYKDGNSRLQKLYRQCDGNVDMANDLLEKLKLEYSQLDDGNSIKKQMLRDDIETFEKKIRYTEVLKDDGIVAYVVDEKPYQVYFGANMTMQKAQNLLVVVSAMIMIFANLYWIEKKSNVMSMINSTKNGRRRLVIGKIVFVCLTTLALLFATYGRMIINHWSNYGFPYFEEKALNVSLFKGIEQPIGSVIIHEIAVTAIVLVTLGVLMLYLSYKVNYKLLMLVLVAVLVVPLVFYVIGMDWAEFLNVARYCDISKLIVLQ